jgi:hypothetical protein
MSRNLAVFDKDLVILESEVILINEFRKFGSIRCFQASWIKF